MDGVILLEDNGLLASPFTVRNSCSDIGLDSDDLERATFTVRD